MTLALFFVAFSGAVVSSLVPFVNAEILLMDGARGMVETGDWLVPRYQGEPFFDKPALTYWLMAAAFRAFGFSLGAGRLVSALAALASVAATAWLGRLLLGRRPALYGALALGTTLLVLSFGRVAMSAPSSTSRRTSRRASRALAGSIWYPRRSPNCGAESAASRKGP